jgi:hypothetical protein
MSWDDYSDRGESCADCGDEVEAAHHAYCPACYRKQMGWDQTDEPEPDWHEPGPPAGTPPESFIVALTDVRRELEELRGRLERLEGAA